MNGELAETLDAAEADGVWNLEEILKRMRFLMQTKKMRQSERRVVQCVGEVHELWSVNGRNERDGT